MCWGERDYNYLGGRQVLDTTLVQFGTPRSALWGDSGKTLHRKAAVEMSKKYGEFVVLATSFVWENSTLSPELYGEVFTKYGANQAEHSISKLNEGMSANRDKINLAKALELVETIIQETEMNIVIRRHPLEKPELAKNLLINPKRVYLDNELNISPLLIASKSVLHMGSTIAIEALSYGKPVASLSKLFSDSEFDSEELSTLLSQRPENKSELLDFLRTSFDDSKNLDPSLLSHYGKLDFYSNFTEAIMESNSSKKTSINGIRILSYVNLKGILGTYLNLKSRDTFKQLDRAKRPNIGLLATRRIITNVKSSLGGKSKANKSCTRFEI
jgi:hypothetical protein